MTTMINAFDASAATNMAEQERALIARRERVLGPAYRLFYANPVHLVRGEGVWLYDPDGNAYLDVYNNVACVGHCHPHVTAALSKQAATLNTHTRYLTDGIVDYAERLLSTFPKELSNVMFACTGSEANDLAYRAARTFTGGTGVIVTQLAYHGVTIAISEMSPSLGSGIELGSHVRTVPACAVGNDHQCAGRGRHFLFERFARNFDVVVVSTVALTNVVRQLNAIDGLDVVWWLHEAKDLPNQVAAHEISEWWGVRFFCNSEYSREYLPARCRPDLPAASTLY